MASTDASASQTRVTAAGAGTTVDFTTAKRNVSAIMQVTGTVTGGVVAIEASHDGAVWAKIHVMGPTTGFNQAFDNKFGAYRYWRSRVLTEITGGGDVSTTFMEAG